MRSFWGIATLQVSTYVKYCYIEILLLQTSFIKFDAAIATFKNLLNLAVLEERLNKMDIEKVR